MVVDYTLTDLVLNYNFIFCKVWSLGSDMMGVSKGTGNVVILSNAFILVIMVR